jgi:hypothetical protein
MARWRGGHLGELVRVVWRYNEEYLSFVGTAGFFTFCFWVGTLKRPLEASDAFFLYRAYCAFLICSPRYTEYE